MKKLKKLMKNLSLSLVIQLCIALICSLAVPVYAWFTYQDRIEAMSKIKEPPSLNLASGGDDPALYISLENIDVSSDTEKYIVFSVEPGKYSAYDLQLSYTTNIPFTYEIYRLVEDENGTIEYIDHTRTENTETRLNYRILSINDSVTVNGKIQLSYVNASGTRPLGDEEALGTKNRRNYDVTNDDVNQYVKPLYQIARKIPQLNESVDGSDKRDYYAIKISWRINHNLNEQSEDYWDYAFNNKETDIIYISAKENSID